MSSATYASSKLGTPKELFYLSLNEEQPTTIVLLHSLMSSHREWGHITPYLSNYHLLIPDLPGHCSSRHLAPFTLSNAAKLVGQLILNRAHNAKCHLVGFSAGGFISVVLAKDHPELIQTLFVSGVYNMACKARLLTIAPYIGVPVNAIQNMLPIAVSSYLSGYHTLPPGVREDMASNNNFTLMKAGCAGLLEFGEGYPVKVRTLAVAGVKHDDVEETRKLGEVLRRGNAESRAVTIQGALHGWGFIWPELFADSIKAWIEERSLSKELENLV